MTPKPVLFPLSHAASPTGEGRRGWHSLYYFTTGMTRPGPGVSKLTSVGYMDDVQGLEEPWTPWIQDNEGQEYWDQETEIFRSGVQNFCVGLQNIMDYYNQSEEGVSHLWLRRAGLHRAGQGHAELDAADARALNIKHKWEADGTIAK
uniref:MHC class I-like antigen recognition-like domain-containing protein n=1 Tax=Ornithorhynchus anatinus TaxID=9258 RepID=A0A6I8MZI3_ORNAN